jgi:hypothetical protein
MKRYLSGRGSSRRSVGVVLIVVYLFRLWRVMFPCYWPSHGDGAPWRPCDVPWRPAGRCGRGCPARGPVPGVGAGFCVVDPGLAVDRVHGDAPNTPWSPDPPQSNPGRRTTGPAGAITSHGNRGSRRGRATAGGAGPPSRCPLPSSLPRHQDPNQGRSRAVGAGVDREAGDFGGARSPSSLAASDNAISPVTLKGGVRTCLIRTDSGATGPPARSGPGY